MIALALTALVAYGGHAAARPATALELRRPVAVGAPAKPLSPKPVAVPAAATPAPIERLPASAVPAASPPGSPAPTTSPYNPLRLRREA